MYPKHPGQTSHGSREVGDDAGLSCSQVGAQGRSTVKAEPAEPEKDGAEDDKSGVLWLVSEARGTISAAFTEEDGDCEGGGARGDMDGCTTGEIEAAHDCGPAVGIPGPACDGVVDDGGPYEDEDKEGAEPSALSDGTHGNGRTRYIILI